jgi:hypothetical protein
MLACAFASAAMIAMSTSGAMAVVGCAGTAGTSGFTSVQAQFNLQCMQPIILPTTLQPLQSFGGSEVVRTNTPPQPTIWRIGPTAASSSSTPPA